MLFGLTLGEGRGDEGRDHAAPALSGMGQRIAHKMNAAALPCGAQHLGDSGFDTFMGIGDHKLHAAQAAPRQLAQELRPDRLGFRGADLHAQHLAPAVGIDAHGDDDGDRDDAPATADFQVGRVDPDIGPSTP